MTIEERVAYILSKLLKQEIYPQTSIKKEDNENWDSITHIEIIVSIEEAFNIKIKPEDIPHLTSMSSIVEKVRELYDK